MIWPFRRKRKPVHVGPTSVDWKPGDMAECVDDAWYFGHDEAPALGDRLMVKHVFAGTNLTGETSGFGLRFIGKTQAYDHLCFRKIVLTETGADRKVSKRAPNPQPQEA